MDESMEPELETLVARMQNLLLGIAATWASDGRVFRLVRSSLELEEQANVRDRRMWVRIPSPKAEQRMVQEGRRISI